MSRARDLADGTFSGAFEVDSPTLVVDAANNRVGIGTSSPAHKLTVAGYSNVDAANKLAIGDNAGYQALIYMESANETLTIENTSDYAGRATIFKDNGTERARIDALGSLLVGTATRVTDGSNTLENITLTPTYSWFATNDAVYIQRPNNTDGNAMRFARGEFIVGSITVTASSTAFNTSSDYRLKENVVPLAGAADRLMQIPVHRFNFIADPDTTVDGFLADEVQAFVPECVTGEKDQVETVEVTDEDGNVTTETRPVYQGIDQSKLVPLLTAALQEALADIATLKAEVAALKGSA
jgi:hypothetical protein